MTHWNYDYYGYDFDSDPLYLCVPFFIEVNRRGFTYGILFDNPSQSFYDMGYSNPECYYIGSQSGGMNYHFIYRQDIKAVIEQYTQLTGRMPMPPKYMLGYQQSRFSYPSAAVVTYLADTFRKKNIPCDVIYLDVDFQDAFNITDVLSMDALHEATDNVYVYDPSEKVTMLKLYGDIGTDISTVTLTYP